MGSNRGQFVLLAAVALAIALVPIALATVQFGYHADVRTSPTETDRLVGLEQSLSRATHEAAASVPAAHSWSERDGALQAVRAELSMSLQRLNRSRLARGTTVSITPARQAAKTWARSNCPTGRGQPFGACLAHQGLIIQNRANRTHVLGFGVTVSVSGQNRWERYTTVIEVWPTPPR